MYMARHVRHKDMFPTEHVLVNSREVCPFDVPLDPENNICKTVEKIHDLAEFFTNWLKMCSTRLKV